MLFYYKISKKILNKVLYNIKITIFAPEIKSEPLLWENLDESMYN